MGRARLPLSIVAGVLLALGTPSAVAACTAVLRPVEAIIRESEVVVRADVVGAEAGHRGEPGHVTLRVLDVLKGSLAGVFITVPGRLADYRVPAGRRPPYAEIDCEGRAPGCASCFARTYKASGQYLLLLKGGTPYWAPLSPTNEEVSGPDDPWITWVRPQLAR